MPIINFWSPLKLSLQVSSLSLLIVLILGVFLARFMGKSKFKGKVVVETLLLLPIVLPPTVIGFLLIVIFGNNSPLGRLIEDLFKQPVIFTFWAAVIASTVAALPLMYQTVRLGFDSIDTSIEEAARVDGAGEKSVFLYVSLPLSYQSIITGTILSFARSLGEFGATYMFAGNIPGRTQTVPIAIYSFMESGNTAAAWILAGIMVLLSFVLLFATGYFKK